VNDRSRALPEPWRVELRRGLRRLRAGEFDRAEAHFSRAHRYAPTRPEVCYALGRERLRQGQVVEAESLLRVAWEGDPTLLSAAASLARCLGLHQGRFAEALALLEAAEAEHGGQALIDVVRAELHIEHGRLDLARSAAEAALARCDDPAEPAVAGDDGLARQAAGAALARVLNAEGIALAEAGDHAAALFAFKRAVDLDPDWSAPHVNIGASFVALGKPRRARRAYEEAVAVEPENPIAHYDLGLLLRAGGETAEARMALERAAELDPRSDTIASALADLYIDLDEPGLAVELMTDVVERRACDADAWTRLGAAFLADGDREGAEAAWRQALSIDPDHRGACRRLADTLARDGRVLEATIYARRALNASCSDPSGEP
jgi:tetratricopeptide (TPR) repeat protein